MKFYTLIHIALKREAKPIIEYFKLRCIQSKPYRLYVKNDIVLIVSGMGAKNTLHVESIFERYSIKKAISIGIAGCKDRQIEIGTMFCTNQKLEIIDYASLTTVDKALDCDKNLKTTLVDMEAEAFLHISQKFLHAEDIYVLKIVSDWLDTTIPKKEFVWKIIKINLKSISAVVAL